MTPDDLHRVCQPPPKHQLQLWINVYAFFYPGINPSLWDKEDVAHWLHWAQKEYSLRRPERGHFEMNGRALCLLTKEDFRRRCPSSGRHKRNCRTTISWLVWCVCFICAPWISAGDVLYEILQCVKQQRRSITCEALDASPSLGTQGIQSAGSCQVSANSVSKSHPPTLNDIPGL